jgi:hypothetical protein
MNDLDQKITQLEQISGYTFQNKMYAAESIQHANEVAFIPLEGSFQVIVKSTRLAIVGNDLLNSVLSTMWYEFRNDQGTQHMVIGRRNLTTSQAIACRQQSGHGSSRTWSAITISAVVALGSV